jgi:hypothetical protein
MKMRVKDVLVFGLTFAAQLGLADELADEVFHAIDNQDKGLKKINKEVRDTFTEHEEDSGTDHISRFGRTLNWGTRKCTPTKCLQTSWKIRASTLPEVPII